MKYRKPGSLCLGPHVCSRVAIWNRNPVCLGNSQRRQRRSHMIFAHLIHLLDSRHLFIVKKKQGWTLAKHLVVGLVVFWDILLVGLIFLIQTLRWSSFLCCSVVNFSDKALHSTKDQGILVGLLKQEDVLVFF